MSDPTPDPNAPPPMPTAQPVQFEYAGATPAHPAVYVARPRGPWAHVFFEFLWMIAAAFAVAFIALVILFGGQLAKAGVPGVIVAALISFSIAIAWSTFVDRLRAAAAERTIAIVEQGVRSGVPLPEFLRAAAGTEPHFVARGLKTIHTLLHHGIALPNAFAKAFPRAPGWLADALDVPPGVPLARSLADLRTRLHREHATQMFTLGPARGRFAFTAVAALLVLCFFVAWIAPSFVKIARDFGLHSPWVDRLLAIERLFDSGLGVALVLATLTLLLIWIARTLAIVASSRYGAPAAAGSLRGSIAQRIAEAIGRVTWQLPLVGAQQRDVAWADFFGRLANQVGGALPLPDAVQTASSGASSHALHRAADRVAARLRSGQPLGNAIAESGDFPPVASGLLASAGNASQLSSAARLLSDRFGERAARRAEVVQSILPVLLTLVFAGVVLSFVLMIFMPMIELIDAVTPAEFKVTP